MSKSSYQSILIAIGVLAFMFIVWCAFLGDARSNRIELNAYKACVASGAKGCVAHGDPWRELSALNTTGKD